VTRSLDPEQGKSWVVTLLLALIPVTGIIGLHRFYTGHIGIGILQVLTAGGCGIWWLIDVLLILLDSYRDSDGFKLVR
jgi:TM2 domain-containing membrane protein YozV